MFFVLYSDIDSVGVVTGADFLPPNQPARPIVTAANGESESVGNDRNPVAVPETGAALHQPPIAPVAYGDVQYSVVASESLAVNGGSGRVCGQAMAGEAAAVAVIELSGQSVPYAIGGTELLIFEYDTFYFSQNHPEFSRKIFPFSLQHAFHHI
jgi:hypothetical protein